MENDLIKQAAAKFNEEHGRAMTYREAITETREELCRLNSEDSDFRIKLAYYGHPKDFENRYTKLREAIPKDAAELYAESARLWEVRNGRIEAGKIIQEMKADKIEYGWNTAIEFAKWLDKNNSRIYSYEQLFGQFTFKP